MNTIKNCSDNELFRLQTLVKTVENILVCSSEGVRQCLPDLHKALLKLKMQVEKESDTRNYAMSKRISAKQSK